MFTVLLWSERVGPAQWRGLIALLLTHFRPRLKSHHTVGGKEKEGSLIKEAPVCFKGHLIRPARRPARNLQFPHLTTAKPQEVEPSVAKGGTGDLMTARGHDPSISPAGEVHHSRRRQRHASSGSQTAHAGEGMLAWTSPASQYEEDGLKSTRPRTN